jgi:hypothetical protein
MDHKKTRQDVIDIAMKKLNWKKPKVLSWYKLENHHLGGASPEELVNRGESARVIAFLERRERERSRYEE